MLQMKKKKVYYFYVFFHTFLYISDYVQIKKQKK